MNLATLISRDVDENPREINVMRELWVHRLPTGISAGLSNIDTMSMKQLLTQADALLNAVWAVCCLTSRWFKMMWMSRTLSMLLAAGCPPQQCEAGWRYQPELWQECKSVHLAVPGEKTRLVATFPDNNG